MLSVVVLTKNSERTIERCLKGLMESSIKPRTIIIVDGGSTDRTLDIVRKYSSVLNIKVLQDRGGGLAIARDIGWRSTNTKYVAMIDSDVVVNRDFFNRAIELLEKDSTLGAIGAKLKPICEEKGILSKFQEKNLAIHLHWNEPPYPSTVPAVHTACTVFRRKAIEEAGGFDPYFRLAKEDSDISFKLRKRGYKLSYIDLFSLHMETGKRFWSINFRYGRSYPYISRKHPDESKLWTKKNVILTISFFIIPLQLIIFIHYLRRYYKLKDLRISERILLAVVETLRQYVRTAGMLYELIVKREYKR